MSFRKYLKSRLSDENMVGDLARDAVYDKTWRGWSSNGLRRHLYKRGVFGSVWKSLEIAENEFRRDRQNNKPAPQSKAQASNFI
jgi:hypothetical protein